MEKTKTSRCKTGFRIHAMAGITHEDIHYTFWILSHDGDMLNYSPSYDGVLVKLGEWTGAFA